MAVGAGIVAGEGVLREAEVEAEAEAEGEAELEAEAEVLPRGDLPNGGGGATAASPSLRRGRLLSHACAGMRAAEMGPLERVAFAGSGVTFFSFFSGAATGASLSRLVMFLRGAARHMISSLVLEVDATPSSHLLAAAAATDANGAASQRLPLLGLRSTKKGRHLAPYP